MPTLTHSLIHSITSNIQFSLRKKKFQPDLCSPMFNTVHFPNSQNIRRHSKQFIASANSLSLMRSITACSTTFLLPWCSSLHVSSSMHPCSFLWHHCLRALSPCDSGTLVSSACPQIHLTHGFWLSPPQTTVPIHYPKHNLPHVTLLHAHIPYNKLFL